MKIALADEESLRRIFTIPEDSKSTLAKIEQEISHNIHGFLNQHIVSGEIPPHELEKDFTSVEIPENPVFVSEQAEFLLSKVVSQSVHTSSPYFIGHMTSALPYFMLPIGKIMMALNQNLVKIETSKVFTPLERQVVGMLHQLVYKRSTEFYDGATQNKDLSIGSFCSGGTIANLMALWVARNKLLAPRDAFEGCMQDGLCHGLREYGLNGLAVLVSERGHYSLSKATDVLGIGKKHLVSVATDDDNKICIKDLQSKIDGLRQEKIGIAAVIGIAGTTETGSIDPLDKIADICQREEIHYHVDAAWGGPTLFSDKHKSLLKGIDRADSVTIDAHKQLYVPIGAGVVLFKDNHDLCEIEQHANYIIRSGSRDLGKHTLEGSRPGMAMMVHSGLRVMGRKGYELLIDTGLARAKLFAKMIEADENFELVTAPELNLVTYRYVPKEYQQQLAGGDLGAQKTLNDRLNTITTNIQKDQRAAGKSFVSRTKLTPIKYGGKSIDVFRVVLANPLTTEDILKEVLAEQTEIGRNYLS